MTDIKGHTEPRIYTKPRVELTERTTLGYAVIRFAKNILGIELDPWQQWLAIHALEITGDIEGEWRYRYRVVLPIVGRQNGKTLLLEVIALFNMYVLGVPAVLGMAQTLKSSERILKETIKLAKRSPITENEIIKIGNTNGNKFMQTTQSTYYCAPASDVASRGMTVGFVIMDELLEHKDSEAWGSITKTMNSVPNAQIWGISSAGKRDSYLLNGFRARAHKSLGDPDGLADAMLATLPEMITDTLDDSIGYFEWSAPLDLDIFSPSTWAYANPSLGNGRVSEGAIKNNLATDSEDTFRREVLSQFILDKTDNVFGQEAWQAACDISSEIVGKPYFGVDVEKNGNYASIAVCGRREDGSTHIEIIDYKIGAGWTIDWFRRRVGDYDGMSVGIQERGAKVSAYINDYKAVQGLNVVPIGGRNLTDATTRLYDGVRAHMIDNGADKVYHIDQEVLNNACIGANRKMFADGAFLMDRNKSAHDISPINACIMAFSCMLLDKEENNVTLHKSALNSRNGEVLLL